MKIIQFPFFGQGVAHGDAIVSVSFADVVRHSLLALFPADNWARDETGQPPLREEPAAFPPPHRVSRLPSDSPLRADIGLLPLDHF